MQSKPRFRNRRGVAVAAIALGLLAGTSACSDSDDSATPETTADGTTTGGSEEAGTDSDGTDSAGTDEGVAEYCAALEEIEAYAEELFAPLGEDAPIEDQLDAERQVLTFVQQNGFDNPDLPPEVADDWQAFFDGFKGKLESAEPTEPTPEQQAAEERLLEWEEANCGG